LDWDLWTGDWIRIVPALNWIRISKRLCRPLFVDSVDLAFVNFQIRIRDWTWTQCGLDWIRIVPALNWIRISEKKPQHAGFPRGPPPWY
jgi:hypothetical protein